uniref:Uncharacterized protein n=1 Tax=Lepeophtheirus salmonis TaxID=72036 RepID=A0A0K2UI49_LEPSM
MTKCQKVFKARCCSNDILQVKLEPDQSYGMKAEAKTCLRGAWVCCGIKEKDAGHG